jgi:hypothetical protein
MIPEHAYEVKANTAETLIPQRVLASWSFYDVLYRAPAGGRSSNAALIGIARPPVSEVRKRRPVEAAVSSR